MTSAITDDATVETTDETEVAAEPELIWVSVHNLIPHPDNPRKHPGDITEMVRSVKAKGVIEPVTLLPADDEGHHMVVCGFRRRAATLEAVETAPRSRSCPPSFGTGVGRRPSMPCSSRT
jgi:hypothetical protein